MGLRVAALYDVHGNLPALDTVLAELEDVPVDVVVFGGDVVWGPWPAETLTPASPPSAWTAALAGISPRVVVCGHTHLPGEALFGGVRIINPGSVGAPVGRAVAWWAVLGPDVELRMTDYDVDATIEAARAVLPDIRSFERWLHTPPTYEQRLAALMGSC